MSVMKDFLSNSYLFGSNAPFVEELYESWLGDPQSVPQQWRAASPITEHSPSVTARTICAATSSSSTLLSNSLISMYGISVSCQVRRKR